MKLESKKDEKNRPYDDGRSTGFRTENGCRPCTDRTGFLGTENYIANAFGVDLNARTNVATAEGAYATNVKNVFHRR